MVTPLPLQFLQLRTPDRCFKVVMCGDSGVGKSSFVQRFCHNSFTVNTQVTIEIGFHMKSLVLDNTVVSLQIWDTAGQESIPHAYFRKADGVLLLYDLSCEKSFLNVKSWIASIREHDDNAVIMLVGNKEDLAAPYREVPREAALKSARVRKTFGELQKKEDDNVSRVYTMEELEEEHKISFAPKRKRKCCNF
ncbi:ras and EF-hand domain-containing protein homolog [Diadema setosum]|uniref:ras and EF-hand domain-containing protein homolog n=1 Tax=Diadema setosum TaxID=31175 RepID=UPI003B3BB856